MEKPIIEEGPEGRHAAIYELARQQGVTVVPFDDLLGGPQTTEDDDVDVDDFLSIVRSLRHLDRFKDLP